MPEYSLCLGEGCDVKESCIRFRLKREANHRWLEPKRPGKECEFYTAPRTKLKRTIDVSRDTRKKSN